MKTRLLIIFLVTISSVTLRSQISEKLTGISEVKLSYILSSMSAGGYHFKKGETIIPYGTGLELTCNLSKRVSSDFGISESLKINNKTGIFTSQFYGYYLTGDLSGLESIDLKIGLTYNFK